jgi:hypothetical protein
MSTIEPHPELTAGLVVFVVPCQLDVGNSCVLIGGSGNTCKLMMFASDE